MNDVVMMAVPWRRGGKNAGTVVLHRSDAPTCDLTATHVLPRLPASAPPWSHVVGWRSNSGTGTGTEGGALARGGGAREGLGSGIVVFVAARLVRAVSPPTTRIFLTLSSDLIRPNAPKEPTMTSSRSSSRELDPKVIQEAIVNGARSAFVALYHHYEGKVRYGVAQAVLKSGRKADIEELLQEIWCRLMSNDRRLLSYYDPERGRFGPFIGWVAYQQTLYVLNLQCNKTQDERLPRGGDLMMDDHASRFAAEVIQSDLVQKLLDQVDAELDEPDRVLLREHYLADKTLREVANGLGVCENTIYQRNHRLKKKLLRIGEQLRPQLDRTSASSPPMMAGLMTLVFFMVHLHAERRADDSPRIEGHRPISQVA
ncbi:MAG: sigma-70 family RNA polymerase sigma factor [Myxococcales bacterium]|nr:sigma-70 family RNA polymerase sigma factor [Myxococcales bacterium]